MVDDSNSLSGLFSVDMYRETGDTPTTRLAFIPEIEHWTVAEFLAGSTESLRAGILVLASTVSVQDSPLLWQTVQQFQRDRGGLLICCTTADQAAAGLSPADASLAPDVVVFDGSMTDHVVPFGAFTARPDLYSPWTKKEMSTFHSTTSQPNSISTQHFLKCLERINPRLHARLRPRLDALTVDSRALLKWFRKLYHPTLGRTISGTGFDSPDVTASGHYVRRNNRRYFDGIAGVACSLRGHNPESWADDMRRLQSRSGARDDVAARLWQLTGLPHHVPAVSGAAAAEQALKLALIAQWPRTHVITLRGGFGGKTLLALTGTERPFYRTGLDPLYPDVTCIDPFAPDAVEQLDQAVRDLPVALIQLELVQGVGGVREIPKALRDHLAVLQRQADVALFVDEVQTGMFRTGPFCRSSGESFVPDLLTLGKGTSDMLFPFALTLYSDRIQQRLQARRTDLPDVLRHRFGFELGYLSVLNTLLRNDQEPITPQVRDAEGLIRSFLGRELSGISTVRDIRVFGLLVGIELDLSNTLFQHLQLNAVPLYLLQMMKHPKFPLLMGYCQYEPHVLKLTPPLTIQPQEIAAIARTMSDTLRTSPLRLLSSGLQALIRARAAP